MLAYNIAIDFIDEYLKIGESTVLEFLKNFATESIQTFGQDYFRKPTQANVYHLLQVAKAHNFFSMLESIDCMH